MPATELELPVFLGIVGVTVIFVEGCGTAIETIVRSCGAEVYDAQECAETCQCSNH